jgi:DNA-binding transcriptional LysR family regulator
LKGSSDVLHRRQVSGIGFEVSLAQLRCFIAVVSAGSVAEAGRRLGMSPASVSKAISRLEEAAGLRLLHRSTHAMSLTEDGERLLGPAREVMRAAQTLEDAATSAVGEQGGGVVRITAAVGLVRHVLVPLASELVGVHPDLRLDVRATNEIVDLAEHGIDLAVRSGSLDGLPGHVHRTWFRAPWVICAAPGYLERRSRPERLRDLDDHDLLGFRNRRSGRVEPWPHRTPNGDPGGRYELRPRLAFDDGDAVWDAMLAGAGIACAPLYLAASALRSGRAVELLAAWRDADIDIAMVRRERHLTPGRVTRLIEFLTAHPPPLDDLL